MCFVIFHSDLTKNQVIFLYRKDNIFNFFSPCLGYNCMEYASCVEKSTASDPKTTCECQLGRIMNDDQDEVSIFFKQSFLVHIQGQKDFSIDTRNCSIK